MTQYKYQAEFDILTEAFIAARDATRNYLQENPNQWFPCGFSWVKIKPARGRFIAMCKDKQVGERLYGESGYSIWDPSNNSTQWLDAKMQGSKAFAAVLVKHGINAVAVGRVD